MGWRSGSRSSEHDVSVGGNQRHAGARPAEIRRAARHHPRGAVAQSQFTDGELDRCSTGVEICLVPGGQGRVLTIGLTERPPRAAGSTFSFRSCMACTGRTARFRRLCQVARVPLAACGILGLAATLDKDIAKQLLQVAGLPVARSVTIHQDAPPALERGDAVDDAWIEVVQGGTPVFQQITGHRPWVRDSDKRTSFLQHRTLGWRVFPPFYRFWFAGHGIYSRSIP